MRRPLYLAAAIVATVCLQTNSAHAQTLEDIIAANIKSKGGLEKIKATTTVRMSGSVVARWSSLGCRSNYPMALESSRKRVLVAFRQPATLVSFDADSGAVQERVEICGDADDVFVDARRGYIYVACGQGVMDVLSSRGDRTTRVARIETSPGARTAFFSPELDRLFVAARAAGGEGAAVWVFRPADTL